MYVRAIALFLPVIAALATLVFPRFWGIRNRFQFVSLMLFTICTCLAPWELWLYKKTGSWTLLSTAPSSSIADGLRLEDRDISSTTFTALPSDVREFVLENRTTPLKSTTAVLALLFRTLSERPVMLIKFGLLKASYCWYLTHSGAWQTQLALLNGFYLLLAGIGLWMVRHQKKASARPLLATSVALVLYFWGLATVAMAIHRYLFPIMGLIFMFAAVCLVRIWAMLPPLQDVLE